MADLVEVATIVQAYKMPTCPDPRVRGIADGQLCEVARRRIGRPPTPDDLARYLSGDLCGEFGRDGGDVSSLWTRVRNATRRLANRLPIEWSAASGTLCVRLGRDDPAGAHPIEPTGRNLEWKLKDAIRHLYASLLVRKPDQGKTFRCFSGSAASSHFMRSGFATRFCDWRFIHRARLGCVPLNATRRFGDGDKRCRRCGEHNETLPHVVNHCKIHSAAWQRRHNAVQDRLVKAIPARMGVIHVNKRVPGSDSALRPDIVVVDETKSRLTVVDVAIPFEGGPLALEGGPLALERAIDAKLAKYAALAEEMRAKGWETTVDALIVGALGSWDQANEPVLKRCAVSPRYATLMRRLMCSDTIRWSRDIYVEHVSGVRQYSQPGMCGTADSTLSAPVS
ncbi:uncharacterized protein LOC123322378 [Coccinella septempunctata]|uniref:uncharacterized protein LOC123322378 n=1 Tax=Coccinella septempunctata TaxID=41139 RepID=UPI001D07F79F|nr:uncharacterized protein LOC123322378 [Coccinella septempunctata]